MASRKQLRRQARTQGRLRYGGEQQGLRQLARAERRELLDTTESQRSAADSIVSSAREGRQDIRGIYEDAGLTDMVRQSLGSNPAARRLAEEMAGAETEMRQREVDAREGAAFAINRATQDYRRDIKDIRDRKLSLKREKGIFVSDLLRQLVGEQQAARAEAQAEAQRMQFDWDKQTRSLMQSERSSLRSSGVNPDTGKPTSKAKAKSKPTGADRDASAALGKAKTWLKRLDNDGYRKKVPDTAKRRAALGELLTAGDQASGVPSLPQHVVEAALDMHFAGRLSPATVKMLRSLGIQVRRLPGVTLGKPPSSRPDTAGNPNVAGR